MNARTAIGTLLIMLSGGVARAGVSPAVTIVDRGDYVEIVARGAVPAAGAQAEPRGVWLDVALAVSPHAAAASSTEHDRTVKRAEVQVGEKPRVSLLLHHDMKAADYAANTVVEQGLAGLVLRVPRNPTQRPVAYAPVPAPDPDASIAPDAVPAVAPPGAPVVSPAPASESPRAAGDSSLDGTAAPAVAAEPLVEARAPTRETSTTLFAALFILSACGVAVLLLARRRRQVTPPERMLEVLNACPLSPRVKLMLVAVGDRELLLSVSDRGAHVLARWRGGEADEPQATDGVDAGELSVPLAPLTDRPGPYTAARSELPEVDVELPAPAPMARSVPSPAVAGLLKLRRRGGEPTASGDPVADEEWARQLLEAMRGQSAARGHGTAR